MLLIISCLLAVLQLCVIYAKETWSWDTWQTLQQPVFCDYWTKRMTYFNTPCYWSFHVCWRFCNYAWFMQRKREAEKLGRHFNNPSSAITEPREWHTLTLHAIDHFLSAGCSATMRDLCKGNVKLRYLADTLTTRLLRLLNQENDLL
jgi:hypothetical protein